MNRHKCILLIVLFMALPPSSILAAELIIHSSGEVRTLVLQSPEPSSGAQDKREAAEHSKYDNYRKVEEKCIRGCEEEKVITKAPAGLSKESDAEGREKTVSAKPSPKIIDLEIPSAETTSLLKLPSEKQLSEKIPMAAPTAEKTYHATISGWKSYQDLVKWMANDFAIDKERYEKFQGRLPVPRTPEETFQLRSGTDIDAAYFLKESLLRINPAYDARIAVLLIRPNIFNRYVCSFTVGGKLYIMDYGTPYREVTGVHGPYHSLEEYQKFYEKRHPVKRKVEAITYLR